LSNHLERPLVSKKSCSKRLIKHRTKRRRQAAYLGRPRVPNAQELRVPIGVQGEGKKVIGANAVVLHHQKRKECRACSGEVRWRGKETMTMPVTIKNPPNLQESGGQCVFKDVRVAWKPLT